MPAPQLAVRPSHAALPAGPGRAHLWLLVEVGVPPAAAAAARPPVDLCLVVDASGSMGRGPGSPLDHALHASRYVLGTLAPTDRAAVVAYDARVELLHPLASDHVAAARSLARAEELGGMTALGPALAAALDLLPAAPGRARHVFLLSDGRANVGEVDPARIAALAAAARDAGTRTATFGLGVDYDEDLLERIAVGGGGGYRFLETPDDAPAAFAAELADVLAPGCLDAAIALEPAPGVRVEEVLGFDAQALPVAIGDVPAGAVRRLLVGVTLPATVAEDVAVAEVVVTAGGPDGEAHRLAAAVRVAVSADVDRVVRGVDAEVLARVAEQEAAAAQRLAARLADVGDRTGARRVLADHRADLAALPPHPALGRKLDELDRQLERLDVAPASPAFQKDLKAAAAATRRSR